ncbi:MAG TPA: DoxX family protein [bacterium]|jgi:putative oxidoreductase|nr:DoxX family protein [bacterium]
MEIGLLIIRLVVGLTLAAHGVQKLFGWFGGYGLDGTGKFFEQLGFVPGKRNAVMAGLAESSGLLLALGLATPLAAMLCFSVMLVATLSVHIKNGFFIQKQGYEYNTVLGLTALAFAFTGAGSLSLDSLLGFNYSGLTMGLGALIVGVVGSAIQLAARKAPAAPKA